MAALPKYIAQHNLSIGENVDQLTNKFSVSRLPSKLSSPIVSVLSSNTVLIFTVSREKLFKEVVKDYTKCSHKMHSAPPETKPLPSKQA